MLKKQENEVDKDGLHMLKKLMLSLLLVVGVIAGCSQVDEKESTVEQVEQVESVVSIQVVDIDGTLIDKDAVISDGDVLMDVLKENFEVEETDGFINGIDTVVADADNKEFLAIYVNDEMAMVGANELELNNGDKVEIVVETWE